MNLNSNAKEVNNWHVNQTPSCGNIKSLILLDRQLYIVAYYTVVRYIICYPYGSISPGRGKLSFFGSSAVTKQFDFFNFSQLF